MVNKGELTDVGWARIAPLLPENGRRGGRWRERAPPGALLTCLLTLSKAASNTGEPSRPHSHRRTAK